MDAARILTRMSSSSASTARTSPSSTSAQGMSLAEQTRFERPHVHQHRTFNLFSAILKHDDLLLYITTQHFEPRELIILYRLSKTFHLIVNQGMTSFVLSSARRWARLTHSRPSREVLEPSTRIRPPVDPETSFASRLHRTPRHSASKHAMEACGTEPSNPGVYSPYDITTIFPFHMHSHLCVRDWISRPRPGHDRLGARSQTSGKPAESGKREATQTPTVRHVPSFRYLLFLLFRARTIHSIISSLLAESHRLPIPLGPSVIAKIWLVMDVASNLRRLALFRNTALWTNTDLYIANMFFVKLDMYFTDPIDGDGETSMRRLLLAQRSLSTLDRVLRRKEGRNMVEVMQLWVKYKYRLSKEHREKGYSVFGVPANEIGMLAVEAWGQPVKEGNRYGVPDDPYLRKHFIQLDDLVAGEALRRELPLHQKIMEMMCYGYVDYATGEALPKTEQERRAWLQRQKERDTYSADESKTESRRPNVNEDAVDAEMQDI